MKNIVVFASGGGTNLQAIMDACEKGALNARVSAVVSNNKNSFALERARAAGVDAYHVSVAKSENPSVAASAKVDGDEGSALSAPVLSATSAETMLRILEDHDADIVFLAGYLRMIDPLILSRYHNRVFNIHPALLPKYGGKGMYGLNAHKAVLEAGDKVSGVTIHRVNEVYDAGDIIARTIVPVEIGDTAETLAARVLAREHEFIVEVLADIISGAILLG
jgi:phosphoribosylglycinamide formyltransferase-1